jgi:hypothetical protein
VPFDTYHRDDQPSAVRAAADGHAPVVVAVTGTGHVVLLDAADIQACAGSVDRLAEAVERAATDLGLTWAAP